MEEHPNLDPNPVMKENSRGDRFEAAVAAVLVIMTLVVFMRLWGRYRYKTPGASRRPVYGESRFWILISDLTILVSYVLAVALAAICFVSVRWGEGLHQDTLSVPQIHKTLKMFYIYQVLYKLVSGVAKVATLFLLLAISTKQMTKFNAFCKWFAVYILAYCVACSLATVFQCGTAIESNWNKKLDQSQCFVLPPFWYSHAAINISATVGMIFLPWWLFSHITYKRKHAVAAIMSALAIGETALGIVRLYGLYTSSHSTGDLTYGTVTGLLVSQLEVNFACIAACVPTVLKMTEEAWVKFCVRVLHLQSMAWSDSAAAASGGYGRSGGAGRGGGGDGTLASAGAGGIHLDELSHSAGRDMKDSPYSVMDKDSDLASTTGSQEHIIQGQRVDEHGRFEDVRGIKIQTDYYVSVEETNEPRSNCSDEESQINRAKPAFETSVRAK